jgi:hypothetical protein
MHGLGALKSGLEFLLLPLGALIVASMLVHGEAIQLSSYVWSTFAAATIAAFALKLHLFRTTMNCGVKDMLGALLAGMALDYIIKMASLRGLVSRTTAWRRTNKFKAMPLGLGSLGCAMPELLLAVTLCAGVGLLAVHPAPGLVHLFMVGWLAQGAQFLAAPLMAILAEHGIKRRATVDPEELLPTQHLSARGPIGKRNPA